MQALEYFGFKEVKFCFYIYVIKFPQGIHFGNLPHSYHSKETIQKNSSLKNNVGVLNFVFRRSRPYIPRAVGIPSQLSTIPTNFIS